MGIGGWDEGKIAASNKWSRETNPYEEGTGPYNDWEAGYDSVEDVDEDGEYVDEADRAELDRELMRPTSFDKEEDAMIRDDGSKVATEESPSGETETEKVRREQRKLPNGGQSPDYDDDAPSEEEVSANRSGS